MSYNFRENIEKMQGYVPGFQPTGPDVIKINSNENPCSPAPGVFQALANLANPANAGKFQKYPPVMWDDFRKVASKLHDVPEEQIICGNGGDEILTMLVRCCCDENRPMAYPVPTYTLYPILADIQNCPVIEIPFEEDFDIPKALFETDAALTILCNPNAPTGTFVTPTKIAELAKAVKGVLLIDEAYADFAPDNCLKLLQTCDNIAILRSMSKGYSLAGMRFGYCLTSPRIAKAMTKVKDSYNINIAAQVAATAALKDQKHFQANRDLIITQRARVTNVLRELGFKLSDSNTNFLLATVPAATTAADIFEKLTEKNIYIRYFNTPELADKLRISIGTDQQNTKLIEALQEILK
ncbi:MAG: histidinol-phosphate transaminase [Phycisphaerae bacterium]|nr:histidinol-phosphate transaminase [Phycisphaerae bacterium]